MNNITIKHQYTVQDYITFKIIISSGEFSGASNFCVSKNSLKDAVLHLEKIYAVLKGTYQLDDYDSNDYIRFECQQYGHIQISGQVGGSYNQQFLKYQFFSDQTILKNLIIIFKNMLE